MEKIISLYQRNYETDHLVRDEIVPGAEWVPAGEGVATRKLDGTACMMRDGNLYKRYTYRFFTVKRGKKRMTQNGAPEGFEPVSDIDAITGKQEGWLPVGGSDNDRWHREALLTLGPMTIEDGTYELVGPKVQGNPEGYDNHELERHGRIILRHAPRTFSEVRNYLIEANIEGIVWHHLDGRMVKLKLKDFGCKRR